MSFGDDTLDPANADTDLMRRALERVAKQLDKRCEQLAETQRLLEDVTTEHRIAASVAAGRLELLVKVAAVLTVRCKPSMVMNVEDVVAMAEEVADYIDGLRREVEVVTCRVTPGPCTCGVHISTVMTTEVEHAPKKLARIEKDMEAWHQPQAKPLPYTVGGMGETVATFAHRDDAMAFAEAQSRRVIEPALEDDDA